MGARGPRLAAFGYFGMGNLGNEASLAALVARVRDVRPDVELTCFAPTPLPRAASTWCRRPS